MPPGRWRGQCLDGRQRTSRQNWTLALERLESRSIPKDGLTARMETREGDIAGALNPSLRSSCPWVLLELKWF